MQLESVCDVCGPSASRACDCVPKQCKIWCVSECSLRVLFSIVQHAHFFLLDANTNLHVHTCTHEHSLGHTLASPFKYRLSLGPSLEAVVRRGGTVCTFVWPAPTLQPWLAHEFRSDSVDATPHSACYVYSIHADEADHVHQGKKRDL